MKLGGCLLFRAGDFGAGSTGFHVEVSSESTALRQAVLEVRLDGPAGPMVGSVPVLFTGGPSRYRALSTGIASGARGGRRCERPLVNVTSFGFEPRAAHKRSNAEPPPSVVSYLRHPFKSSLAPQSG
jgi:hypothetical protein